MPPPIIPPYLPIASVHQYGINDDRSIQGSSFTQFHDSYNQGRVIFQTYSREKIAIPWRGFLYKSCRTNCRLVMRELSSTAGSFKEKLANFSHKQIRSMIVDSMKHEISYSDFRGKTVPITKYEHVLTTIKQNKHNIGKVYYSHTYLLLLFIHNDIYNSCF